MISLEIDEFVDTHCALKPHTLDDYQSTTPRWCKGCGDHGVLMAVERILKNNQINPESVVCVSGIGCSGRLPHYLNTYGFHGIHGRALPISIGIALTRPDLHVLTIMGDGDCFSIGAGHWLHTIRYNVNITVLVLDNQIYALTKQQVSPTSPQGTVTNTTPHGSYLKGLNPLSVMLGVSNVSFLAQTATWQAAHMEATLQKAWSHKGLSVVRILQRCPIYMPSALGLGKQDFSATFLENDEGIPIDKQRMRSISVCPHDHRNIIEAQRIAMQESPTPLGLLYWNPDIPTYEDVQWSAAQKTDPVARRKKFDELLDRFAVEAGS